MKSTIFVALSTALFHSVAGLALPAEYNSAGLISRDKGIQTTFNSTRVNIQTQDTEEGILIERRIAWQPKKATKHCKTGKGKGKGKRAGSSSEDECPTLPTKAQIIANWKSNPKFDASKLFFYSSPPGADAVEEFAKKNYPGYSTMIPSFKPNGWEDTWAFVDEIKDDFWKLASKAFAEVATGTVYVFLPDGDKNAVTWKPTSYWNDELKILMASSDINKIIRINANAPHTKSYMKGSA